MALAEIQFLEYLGDIVEKNKIDYDALEHKLFKKSYKLADVKHQLETVSFDIVRFKDSDKGADLWQIQNTEDGDYIIAKYEEVEKKTASHWEVVLNKQAAALNFYYKGDPLVKVAASKLGIESSELSQAERYLPNSLAQNKKLVKALLSELSESAKNEVLKKYPELF